MTPRLSVWPPLPLSAHLHARAARLPFPLEEPGVTLFARARHGLFAGVQALGLTPGDEVLVPAYHHGSEVEALVRAGLIPVFYEAGETLAPDAPELDRLLRPATRALYLIHYLGFPQDAAHWRSWCDERGLLLLEDAAQAWLATVGADPLGSAGDLAIFCLYKTFGLPDGAALRLRAVPVQAPPEAGGRAVAALATRHAAWLSSRSRAIGALAMRLEPAGEYDPAEDFALGDIGPPARRGISVLGRLGADAAEQRRAHYRVLLDALGTQVPPPFDTLPAGAAPFAFPIETHGKAALLDRLRRAGVLALDFWSMPHPALEAASFPAAARRRETTLCLPVHQELRPADLGRIAKAAAPARSARPQGVLEPLAGLSAPGGEWDALAEATGNVFLTPEWCQTWWKHFGRGRPRLLACRTGEGRLAGLWPLYEPSRRPLRVLRLIGHGPADELGPVCAAADRPLLMQTLAEQLRGRRLQCDLLLAERLASGGRDELGGRVLGRESSPVLAVGGRSWDEYLAGQSRNFRERAGRLGRKLEREHSTAFRLVESEDELEGALDALFELHALRWTGGDSDAFAEPLRAFHREFARLALARGWLRLWLLEIESRPVAAWYGFRYAGADSFYQSGRDPGWDPRSVGFVLLIRTVRAAFDDGMREYRLLRGGEEYKARFATDDVGLETVLAAGSAIGRAASFGAAQAAALPGPLRRGLLRAGA